MSIYKVLLYITGTENDAKSLRKSLAQSICNEYELESVYGVSVDLDKSADNLYVTLPYVSLWDESVEIETTATVNIKTGEVTDIIAVDVGGLETCENEYIVMNGEIVYIYHDEHGYEHWADIHNEFGG